MFVGALCAVFVFVGASCSFTTANLSDTTMAKEVDSETQEPLDSTDTFKANTPVIYCATKVSNAPPETMVKSVWRYTEPGSEQEIDSYTLEADGSAWAAFSLSKPDAGWPKGSYEVDLYIDDEIQETKNFTVE